MFHLDEEVPCIAFDMNPKEQSACWHFYNAKVIPARQNQEKVAKYTESDKKKLVDDVFQFYQIHSKHAWEVANRNILDIEFVENELNESAVCTKSE